MTPMRRRFLLASLGVLPLLYGGRSWAVASDLARAYGAQVDRTLPAPPDEARRYARLAQDALAQAGVTLARPQYLAVVDRDPYVQALLLFFRNADSTLELVGASPVSTGRTGGLDSFETPAGVFEHSRAAADFRSDGVPDADGLLRYGAKGLRVYDFGPQKVPQGWGDGKAAEMRLLMHATDPELLEQRLGSAQSDGGIRIPASLDGFIDQYGLLDGAWLVVVDTRRGSRPDWSPEPYIPRVLRRAARPPGTPPPSPPQGPPAVKIR